MPWIAVSIDPPEHISLDVNTDTRPGARSRLYNSTGFFFIAWATHYFPFFLMGRQLFLHHYLPAHVASCLVTGALLEFVFNSDTVDEDAIYGKNRGPRKHVTARERFAGQSMMGAWIACGVVMLVAAAGWYFFLPLTYGYPGLSVEQIKMRKLLGYDLHFAK